jgi:hypothetical protein
LSSSSGSDGERPRALAGVDPRFLDHLIARHGAPRQAPPLTWADKERRDHIARRERAIAAADPALVRHIERHESDGDQLRRMPAEEPLPERAPIARFDLDAWHIRIPIAELRELEPSEELRRALSHRTPQAFLRDLHRPVTAFGEVQLRRVQSQTSAGATLARIHAAVRSAMQHMSRDELVQPLATRLMEGGMKELRTILARPWADSRPAKPLPMPRAMPGIEDSLWFGQSGGYDPDV